MLNELIPFALSFGFNFLTAFLIVRFMYYPRKHSRNYVFTFLAFNTVIYFLLSLLNSVDLSMGVGFGLFAIFSVLRYRTEPMPAREMTYLFVIIALPVMNAFLLTDGNFLELVLANIAVLAVLHLLEQGWGFRYEASRRITYERIDLLRPQDRPQLLADLQQRTGLAITRVEIGRINYVRDTADLRVYFDEPTGSQTEPDLLDETLLADV